MGLGGNSMVGSTIVSAYNNSIDIGYSAPCASNKSFQIFLKLQNVQAQFIFNRSTEGQTFDVDPFF